MIKVFLNTEQQLGHNLNLRGTYIVFIKIYIELGYKRDYGDSNRTYYLLH